MINRDDFYDPVSGGYVWVSPRPALNLRDFHPHATRFSDFDAAVSWFSFGILGLVVGRQPPSRPGETEKKLKK